MTPRLVLCLALALPALALADARSERALDADVTQVAFEARGRLEIVVGDEPRLVLEARDEAVLDALEVEVSKGRLSIRGDEERDGWFGWMNRNRVTARLVVSDLARVDFAGAGDLVVRDVSGGDLTVRIAGAADCELIGLAVERLRVELAGSSDCNASGSARSQYLDIAGAGSFSGFELATERTEVSIAGVGEAEVAASGELRAEVSGVGDVSYEGSPSLHEEVSGWGSVTRAGGP